MSPIERSPAHAGRGVLAVVFAGVSAALHLGKLPPAIPALQASLGMSLLEAGFMISLIQVAGMTLGLFVGLGADAMGLRRTMLAGLTLVGVASALGASVGLWIGADSHALAAMLVLRSIEGAGFLMVVMPAPGLIRSMSTAGKDKAAMGLWGAYMPLGIALALLLGPLWIESTGWPGWWLGLSGVSLAASAWVIMAVPDDRGASNTPVDSSSSWSIRLRATTRSVGSWAVALAFAVYSAQWLAVIGFLPSIYAAAGFAERWSAPLTALTAALNIVGNLAAGRLLQRGFVPERLLRAGFIVMAISSMAAFVDLGIFADAGRLGSACRYVAICFFSMAGGLVPATLFMLAVRVAPAPAMVSTTVGLMQQASSLGQFLGPPAVAWVAHRAGGWQWTWTVTLACSLAGIAFTRHMAPLLVRARTA